MTPTVWSRGPFCWGLPVAIFEPANGTWVDKRQNVFENEAHHRHRLLDLPLSSLGRSHPHPQLNTLYY